MENGITEQIWRRNHYHSLLENHCEKPNVITVYNIFETILNENYVKKIFQLSLGYPQLTFPMALLTFGLIISIVLASLEKLLHRPKTNFITLLDRFYSFWLSKGLQDRISQIFEMKTPRISSLHIIFYWYLTYKYTEIEFQM